MADTYRIIITQYGVTLGKHSERLVIKPPLPPKVEADGRDRQLMLPFMETEKEPCSAIAISETDIVYPEAGDEPEPSPSDDKPKSKTRRSREKIEIPFFRISELIIASLGVSLSTDLIQEMSERGIPITFMTPGGHPYANLTSPSLTGTVITRREQLKSYDDERAVILTKTIIAAKIKNQAYCLKYFSKYLQGKDSARYLQIRHIAGQLIRLNSQIRQICVLSPDKEGTENIDNLRGSLMGLEGTAGRIYWEGVSCIFADKVEFAGREHRGTSHPVNAALNYGYGILYARIWSAVLYAGLEPFAGFLHVDRPGKPSLILDLIEEFRQPVIDRTVIAYFNLGQEIRMQGGLMDDQSRRRLAAQVNERLETPVPYNGQKLKISSIIQAQARQVAAFLRREREYKPYVMRW